MTHLSTKVKSFCMVSFDIQTLKDILLFKQNTMEPERETPLTKTKNHKSAMILTISDT